ncbi:MAG TPA: PaaI family thioesterase [Solirubrobacter sp.]|nr:PaaI family thioesterase [Solirubrobacter sp.]
MPATRREVIQQFVPNSPLVQHLGMRLEAIEDGRAELVLPFRPELATIDDVVHGGAIASLIDTAGMAATWSDDTEPDSLAGATLTLNVNYTSAARGKDLTAVATVTKRGRSIVFSDVTVTEPDGRVVATGSVVQRFGS